MEKRERLAPERAPFEHLSPGGTRFTHQGIECYVTMGPVSINGYIQLPDGHPWLYYPDSLECHPGITIHGGVTYQEDRVIGFDTAHAGDAWHPQSESARLTPEFHRGHGHVWEEHEVIEETKRLAEQAADAPYKATVSSGETVGSEQAKHPKTLRTLEDFEGAPVGTVVAVVGEPPLVKRNKFVWMAAGDTRPIQNNFLSAGLLSEANVLRWGWGE